MSELYWLGVLGNLNDLGGALDKYLDDVLKEDRK